MKFKIGDEVYYERTDTWYTVENIEFDTYIITQKDDKGHSFNLYLSEVEMFEKHGETKEVLNSPLYKALE